MMHLSTTLTVVWACAGTAMNAGASAQPAIRTDSTEYTWTVDRDALRVEVRWTFTNPLPDTIFFKNCRRRPRPTLEKLVDGEWQPAIGPGIRTAGGAGRNVTRVRTDGSVPVGIGIESGCLPLSPDGYIILPGASRSDKVEFIGYLVSPAMNISVFPFDDFDGTYRLNWSNPPLDSLYRDSHLYLSETTSTFVPPNTGSFSRPLPPDVEIVSAPFTLIDPRDGR